MDHEVTQAEDESPRGGPLRFSFATGSKPLAGYTIKRGIGRGGFGEVYFAVSDGGKEVAIKLIRHNLDVELRGVTHCLNLKHANLIALYDVKQDDQGNSWVVMEYATGESLEEIIRRHPQGMPLDATMDWMQGIAAGVAYLHDHGIVHRDLKPGNIFRDDGQVKLGDYGLSKFISCSRRSGQTESIGTVHYMAPEVANGRYGKEIDIYALGIILYEMLTGHVPFEGESVGEVLMKHLTAEPTLTEVPPAYREVIARALAKDPTLRFESVADLMAALPPLDAAQYRPPLAETRAVGEAPRPAGSPASQPAAQGMYGAAQGAGAQPGAGQYGAGAQGGNAWQAAAGLGAGIGAAAAKTVEAAVVDEEPVWRAIRDGWRATRDSWDGLNTPSKIGLAVLGLFVLSNGATWSFALNYGPPLVLVYVLYRIGRSVVLQQEKKHRARVAANPGGFERTAYYAPPKPAPREQVSPDRAGADRSPPAQTEYRPNAPTPPAPGEVPLGDWRTASARHWKRKKARRSGWREEPAAALVVKSPRQRLTDLVGSLILAAAVSAAMSVVVILLRGEALEGDQFAWLAMTSVCGAWAILIPAKFWEGHKGEAILRRVVMLIVGLLVGGAAYAWANTLLIKFPDSPMPHMLNSRALGSGFFDVKDGSPLLNAYLAYFGSLFFLVGWWRQCDPLRRTRLSIWSTVLTVLVGWGVTYVWQFPQPWGLMVAGIISTSVQLVSPFVPPHERVARPAPEEA
jgi:hypothetical protein